MDNQEEKLLRLLSKDVLKENLAKAGLYVLAYEALKDTIIDRPKGFFTMGRSTNEYEEVVLNLHPKKNPLFASLRWWQQAGVLTEQDFQEFLQLRKHRNEIAHTLPKVLLNTDIQVDERKLVTIYQLLVKIDRWWLMEIEIPCNEDFDGQEIDPSEVQSGYMHFLGYLITVLYQSNEQRADSAT
jgi:hypothetical protein